MSVLGLDSGYTVKYNPLLREFPWASPSGTPSAKGLYLAVYPLSCPNTDTMSMHKSTTSQNCEFCVFIKVVALK